MTSTTPTYAEAMAADSQTVEPDWIDDDHQVRVTLGRYGFEYTTVCPHDGADLTGTPWEALPVCRRAGDEDGNPRPDKSPTGQCALGIFAEEWSADELFVFEDGAEPFEVVSPFPVEYRFCGWEGDEAQVRVKTPAPESLLEMARRQRTVGPHPAPGQDDPTHAGPGESCQRPECVKSRAQHEAAADIQELTAELFGNTATNPEGARNDA